ncbi:hypothetical protein EV121DRAFT_279642 [Schizophyllum commune]
MRRRSSRASPDLQDLQFASRGGRMPRRSARRTSSNVCRHAPCPANASSRYTSVALPRYLEPPGPAASTLKLIIDPSSQMGLRNFSPRDRGVVYGGQGLLREEGGGPREAT